MKKIFNALFYIIKFPLLIAAFGLTLFVLIRMNIRLNKDISSIIFEFIPFILLLIYLLLIFYLNKMVLEKIYFII